MSLPVIFKVFGIYLPAHMVMETLAYAVGFRLYLYLRKKQLDTMDDASRLTVLVGAILGAAIGSKLLGFLEHPELWALALTNPVYFLFAKTILGGLLGGIVGVELAKNSAGITRSTGDLYVFPLLVAMSIGRVGCLLTGVSDGTWGNITRFFAGFDAGDGLIRHPTPLYEIFFLCCLGGGLYLYQRRRRLISGDLFKLFILAYCAWRFVIEFLKPVTTYSLSISSLNIVQVRANTLVRDFHVSGLSVLQIAALAGFAYYAWILAHRSVEAGINGGA